MNYLLDTDICIYFIKGKYDLQNRLKMLGKKHLFISEITVAELKFGAENSQRIEHNKKAIKQFINTIQIVPIFESLDIYAKEKSRLKKSGLIIDDFDLLIASTAIKHQMTLLTRNEKHFKRIENLKFENWIDNYQS